MKKLGVISRVEGPTDWCLPCVVIPKENGKIQVCIDYSKLNELVKRECHPLPTTEETLGMLSNASYFSRLVLANRDTGEMPTLDHLYYATR